MLVTSLSYAQSITNNNQLIPFDRYLNQFAFEDIRDYVIANGDRKTYCPNYKDNPHYKIENSEVEIYLNPTNQEGKQPADRDYNVLYIIDEGKFHYYIYLAPDNRVYLYDYDNQLNNEYVRDNKVQQVKRILDYMLQQVEL